MLRAPVIIEAEKSAAVRVALVDQRGLFSDIQKKMGSDSKRMPHIAIVFRPACATEPGPQKRQGWVKLLI